MRALGSALLLWLCACGASPFEPLAPMPYAPPPEYRTWWGQVEACSGKFGDFDRVTWLVAEEPARLSNGDLVVGRWDPPHTITVARAWTENSNAVKHEMLHDLLQTRDHPTPPFGTCTVTAGFALAPTLGG